MTKTRPQTLEEIESLERNILRPEDVCGFLGACQHTINMACEAGKLPYAYKLGKRTIIPKQAFLFFHRYGLAVLDKTINTNTDREGVE